MIIQVALSMKLPTKMKLPIKPGGREKWKKELI